MNKKSTQMTWWLIAIIAFVLFVLLQLPASWLISKFYKDNQILQNVSGNIWQGQADWRKGDLKGSVAWNTRPLDLFLFRLGANLDVQTGETHIKSVVGYSFGQKIIIKQMSGQIAPETLKTLVDWQWPANLIQLKDVQFNFKKDLGFSEADGSLQWGGGELLYIFSDRQDRMNIPSLNALITDDAGKLKFDIQDQRQQKMASLVLDQSMMLDVQLTQRLLLNVPSYDGKAGLDTYVITTRQPLLKGGF